MRLRKGTRAIPVSRPWGADSRRAERNLLLIHFRINAEVAGLVSNLKGDGVLRLNYASPITASIEIFKDVRESENAKQIQTAFAAADTTGEIVDQQVTSHICSALSQPLEGKWANFRGVPEATMRGIYLEIDRFFVPLKTLVDQSLAVLRWRIGESIGPSNPLQNVSQYLSQDGKTWLQISTARSVRIRFIKAFAAAEVTDALAASVVELVGRIGEEPLGHQLFREAWSLRDTHPRSALVIGVASAEVGLKKLIGTLVPHAQWLVDELQSPSLGKMIRKYLPTLPVKRRFVTKSLRPPNSLVNRLDRAVEFRNKVVHAGQAPPVQEELDDMLRAVDDLLHVCDLYAGFEWAANFISYDTLSAWEEEYRPEYRQNPASLALS